MNGNFLDQRVLDVKENGVLGDNDDSSESLLSFSSNQSCKECGFLFKRIIVIAADNYNTYLKSNPLTSRVSLH